MTTPDVPTAAATLPAGGQMPLLGFGTWQLTGATAHDMTLAALQSGYRHIDTATMYGNEREVGAALQDSGVPRDEVFVTTKLPPDRAGQARPVLEQSLEQLGIDTVDLWLVHAPPSDGVGLDIWRSFVQAQQDGLATDIGVSNYDLGAIDTLREQTGVLPAVNQIRWSPLLFDGAVLAGHRRRGVLLEGYSGLKGGVLGETVVTAIADRLGRTPAQVVLRWHLEHDTVAIPRSSKAERVVENGDLGGFSLTAQDVAALDALGGQG